MQAPKKVTFIIALVLGALGVLGTLVSIPVVSGIAIWVLAAGWLLLILGCFVKDL